MFCMEEKGISLKSARTDSLSKKLGIPIEIDDCVKNRNGAGVSDGISHGCTSGSNVKASC